MPSQSSYPSRAAFCSESTIDSPLDRLESATDVVVIPQALARWACPMHTQRGFRKEAGELEVVAAVE
jgi:hypothetical protein